MVIKETFLRTPISCVKMP